MFEEIKTFLIEENIKYEIKTLKDQYYASEELKELENKLSKFKGKTYDSDLKDIKDYMEKS